MNVMILKWTGLVVHVNFEHIKGFVCLRWCGGCTFRITRPDELGLYLSTGQRIDLEFDQLIINLRTRDVWIDRLTGTIGGHYTLSIATFYCNLASFVFSIRGGWLGSVQGTMLEVTELLIGFNHAWNHMVMRGNISIASLFPLYRLIPVVNTVRTRYK